MTAPNPYAADLGDRDPVVLLRETPDRFLELLGDRYRELRIVDCRLS